MKHSLPYIFAFFPPWLWIYLLLLFFLTREENVVGIDATHTPCSLFASQLREIQGHNRSSIQCDAALMVNFAPHWYSTGIKFNAPWHYLNMIRQILFANKTVSPKTGHIRLITKIFLDCPIYLCQSFPFCYFLWQMCKTTETTVLFWLSFLKHLFLVLSSVFVSKQQILTLSKRQPVTDNFLDILFWSCSWSQWRGRRPHRWDRRKILKVSG